MGLGTRLLLSYALFAAIVLVLLWISQTFLLDDLYSMVKHRELQLCADTLAENAAAEGAELEEITEVLAQKYSTCVSIYQVKHNQLYE